MDVSSILVVVISVAPILVIGELADGLGFRPTRWMWIAALIGPFAIPMLYLVAAVSAVAKTMHAPKASS